VASELAVFVLDAACDVDTSHFTAALPQQPVVISDVSAPSDDVSCESRTSEVDEPHPAASPPQLMSSVDADIGTHVDDVVCDGTIDRQHIQDECDTAGLDESLYHDCISASFAGQLLSL